MQVPIHLMLSWIIAHRLPERRDRRLVAWAGAVPDLDALSLLGGAEAYSHYHHVLTHDLVTGVVVASLFTALARQRRNVAMLSLVAFHFHLVCDLLGSGVDWPIVYFYPFSRHEYYTPYGWPLASWQNFTVALAALLVCSWIGMVRGHTFAETFLPARADDAVVKVLRRRFFLGLGGESKT